MLFNLESLFLLALCCMRPIISITLWHLTLKRFKG